MLILLKSPIFIGFSLIVALTYASVLAWLTVAPVLLQTQYGITPVKFGWLAAIIGFTNVIGCILNSRLVGVSFVFPNSFPCAVKPFTNIAGMAASLYSFIQILGGALASNLLAYGNDHTAIPLALMLISCAGLALMIYYWITKQK